MDGNITIADTNKARNDAAVLDVGVKYYTNLVSELTAAKNKMQANWEGDFAALNDVNMRIDAIIGVISSKLIPMLQSLSESVVNFADELDKVSNNEVGNETNTPSNNGTVDNPIPEGGAGHTEVPNNNATPQTEKTGFWSYHGNNFAKAWTSQDWAGAWDYSNVDGLQSAVGTTVDAVLDTAGNVVDAVVDTVGAAVNFVFDGAANLVGWLWD